MQRASRSGERAYASLMLASSAGIFRQGRRRIFFTLSPAFLIFISIIFADAGAQGAIASNSFSGFATEALFLHLISRTESRPDCSANAVGKQERVARIGLHKPP